MSFRAAAMLAGTSLLAAGVMAATTSPAAAAAPAVTLAAALPAGAHGPGPARVAPGWPGRGWQKGSLLAAAPGARPGVLALPGARSLPGGRLVPHPGSNSELDGVFCRTASDCWAVGNYQTGSGARLNQALHWTGSKWSQVSTPNPGGTTSTSDNELFGVRCKAAGDCWAVGEYFKKGAELDQALHWNGGTWSVVPTPTPGGTLSGDVNVLFDVVCPVATSCWAAGEYGNNGVKLNQALHWNGSKWILVTTPNPGGTASGDLSALNSVRCTAPSNCWAVGEAGNTGAAFLVLNQALHWNGSKWSQATTPSPGTATGDFNLLSAVSCTAATNCWADGTDGAQASSSPSLNQALHWDGSTWAVVATPDPDGTGEGARNQLAGLSCTSASNCWAVGAYGSFNGGAGVILNQALHWNGTAWSLKATPDPAGTADGDTNRLFWVHCSATANCWAVGDAQQPAGPLLDQALRWNGTKWSAG